MAHIYEKSVVRHCCTYMHSVMRCSCPKTLVNFILKCAWGVEVYIENVDGFHWFRVTGAYICSCDQLSNIVICRVIPTLEVCTFIVSKSWYCTNYKSWYCTNYFTVESFRICMQSSARIPKLLCERVLCAHWKGVVLIFCTFHFKAVLPLQ